MSTTEKTWEVAVMGAALMDLQVYPVDRSLLDVPSYPAESMTWAVGGDAINEATVLTRLGHRVKLISCIGDDMIGRMVLAHCERNGVDTSSIRIDPEKVTSINIGLIGRDAERTFINNRSGSLWTTGPDDFSLEDIDGARILSFASFFNTPGLTQDFMTGLFQRAKSQNMIICADVVSPKRGETLEDIRETLPYVDYFFPNLEEARRLTGKTDYEEIADVFLGMGVKTVVLKTGKAGCLLKNEKLCVSVPGYPKANAIDTTGAGDNFAAGFISALLEGKEPEECAAWANCTASVAVEAVGATEGVTCRETVDRRYGQYRAIYPLDK